MALPLARPGIISVIVFSFTLTLHEFIYALVFITRSEWRTLGVGVPSELILGDVFFWQPLLASALIIAIPVGLVYNLSLDRLIRASPPAPSRGRVAIVRAQLRECRSAQRAFSATGTRSSPLTRAILGPIVWV